MQHNKVSDKTVNKELITRENEKLRPTGFIMPTLLCMYVSSNSATHTHTLTYIYIYIYIYMYVCVCVTVRILI
jgi:hypothetical protein